MGVDDADSDQTQVFYQTNRSEKLNALNNKNLINKRRQKRKYKSKISVTVLFIFLYFL